MRNLADLCDEVRTGSTIDDVIEAIIYKSGQTRIPKSQAYLQLAFFLMQREEPELLSDFIFNESGITPFSDELDSILFRLEASSVLHTLNPGYESYVIDDSIELLKESYDKLSSRVQEIDRCASLFSNMIKQQAG